MFSFERSLDVRLHVFILGTSWGVAFGSWLDVKMTVEDRREAGTRAKGIVRPYYTRS